MKFKPFFFQHRKVKIGDEMILANKQAGMKMALEQNRLFLLDIHIFVNFGRIRKSIS